MATLEELSAEIAEIKNRNRRVETEKAWETSLTRKLIILFLTYLVTSLVFLSAGIDQPFVNSIVPTVAFVLSNLSLPIFKKFWQRYNKNNYV